MHYLDIIVLIIVIISAIEGGIQGLVYEVCSLIGLVAGFFLALEFFDTAAAYLGFIPLPGWVLKAISFFLILVAVNVIFRFLGKSLRIVLRKVFMGWLDRFAGVIFGLLRGTFIALLIIMILLLTPIGSVIISEAPNTKLIPPALQAVRPFIEYLTGGAPPHPDVI